MTRREQVRELLALTPAEVVARAGERLVVCADLAALHRRFADDLYAHIARTADSGEPLRLIVPVGPTGQYPILVDMINTRQLPLDHVTWYFMDEYCTESGRTFPADHPLSFRRIAAEQFFDRISPGLAPPSEQIVFPTRDTVGDLAARISRTGVDLCAGGIGIHGHVAFNEPAPGIADSNPRQVRLNDYTVTINAVRAGVGGNLEGFPRWAYTLGLRQIAAARRLRLYCRNGCGFDWANTVLRLALFGEPGDDYPVTHLPRDRTVVVTDRDTLASPRVLL